MFETKLLQAFARMNIPCDEQKAAQMHRYFSLLLQANAQMNLTNVTDEDDAILLHFCDSASLLPLFSFPEQSRCLDVGTGAGFPGMVLAILCPDVEFTLMDSLQKRVGFLQRFYLGLLPAIRVPEQTGRP
ncbi:MAG: 16S rRNA (guanine(527)-N(7))-methyltransferase RsmG [Christensenellales bacterium]